MALGHLLYISDAVEPMTRDKLEDIREVSVRKNRENAITGVLFYSAGHFVQLLEGEPGEVRRLFDTIARDPRHRNVRLLIERPAERRVFGDWAMGLLDLDEHDPEHRASLDELVALASREKQHAGAPVELEVLSRFCMLLPAG